MLAISPQLQSAPLILIMLPKLSHLSALVRLNDTVIKFLLFALSPVHSCGLPGPWPPLHKVKSSYKGEEVKIGQSHFHMEAQ